MATLAMFAFALWFLVREAQASRNEWYRRVVYNTPGVWL